MHIKCWIEKIYGKNHLGNVGVNGRTSKWLFVFPKAGNFSYRLSDHYILKNPCSIGLDITIGNSVK